jgi:hypothetical protein
MSNRDFIEWTEEESFEALKTFLESDEGIHFQRLFAEVSLTQEDLSIFKQDALRRQRCKSEQAKTWWTSIQKFIAQDDAKYLSLVEPLAQHGASVEDLYRVMSKVYDPNRRVDAFSQYMRKSFSDLPVGITNVRGWTDEEIQKRIDEVLVLLEFEQTTGSARKWWKSFEAENQSRLALVLRLTEELLNRNATITKFFFAYVYSNTDSIQANLHYMDYTCLKKEEQQKRKEQAENDEPDQSEKSPETQNWAVKQPDIPGRFTNVQGWTNEQILEKVEEVKAKLGWENTTESARKWWEAENEKQHQLQDVLRLAEELANRKATVAELFLAYNHSGTENIQANLYYLDYIRLKREEERKKQEKLSKKREAEKRQK